MIPLLTGSALWSAFGSGWIGRAAGHMLSDLEAVWKWLAADLWRLVAAVVLIAWGVDHVSCHRHAARVEKQLASTTKALGDLRAMLNKETAVLRQLNVVNAAMANQLRKANDEENRRIAADAADLRMRGPGKATCPRLPATPAASSGTSNRGASDAPVAPVPDAGGQQLFALPFDDTTYFGADHDYWRDRALKWDAWYDNLVKAWPKR